MSYRGRLLLFAALALADSLAIGLALAATAGGLALAGLIPPVETLPVLQLSLIPWLLAFAVLRLYDLETVLEDSQEYATVATGCTYGIVLAFLANALSGMGDLPLLWLFLAWAASIVLVWTGRFLMRRVVRAARRAGHLIARAVIVGADEHGRTIARQFRSVADSGVRVVGFVDDFLPAGTPVVDGLSVLGHPGALPMLVREHGVAEIVVVPNALAWETFQEILERTAFADGLRIRLSPGYYDLLATTPRVAHRNFVPLMVVDRVRLSGFDAMAKGVLDFGLSLLGLAPALLLMALFAGWLWQAGRRPVLAATAYLGMGGRPFQGWQFAAGETGLGRLLVETGLQRLPLLFSVLAGHLSLVGPRPVPVAQRDQHRRWLASLATVKPGMTGPWAVVPVASLEEEMRAALYYIRNWTLWLDLQILVQTALVILRRRWGRLA
jgi:lipopolysaccharide/colanic/teichoic acid biosynthesis glycosyltransferase